MEERRLSFWAFAAQFAGLSFSLVLLPMLLRYYPTEKVALWYVIVTLGTVGTLAEISLEPSITRYMTYARNGVATLPVYGEVPSPSQGGPNAPLSGVVVAAARVLHARVGALNLLFLGTLGAVYLWGLSSRAGLQIETLSAWMLFAVAQYVGCRLMVHVPLLQGMGRAAWAFRAFAFQRLTFLLASIVGIRLFQRLEVIGFAQLAGNAAGFGLAWWLSRPLLREVSDQPPRDDVLRCVHEVLRGSVRLWVTRLGAFLIVKSNLLLVSSFVGLAAAASLALSMQALEALTTLAMTPLFSRLPRLYDLRVRGEDAAMKQTVGGVTLLAWVSFVSGALLFAAWGPGILDVLGSRSTLLQTNALVLLLLTGFLEMNHSVSATLLLLENRVPFMSASIVSGVAIVGLSGAILSWTSYGVLGALAVPFVVQLCYNNWKWPVEALRSLRTSYYELVRLGMSWKL